MGWEHLPVRWIIKMWAELKIQEDSIIMAHRWLWFYTSLSSCAASYWSQLPSTLKSQQEPHSQYLSKEAAGAAVSGNAWHYRKEDIYCHNQNILQQSELLRWKQGTALWFTSSMCITRWEAPLVPLCTAAARSHEALKCLGLGGGLSALHSRYGFEDSTSCGGSFISFKISILTKVDTLLLIRKISHNLMFCASVSEHLGTLMSQCRAVLLIHFVQPRPEILSSVSRDCCEILIIMCLEKGKKNWFKNEKLYHWLWP